jgi:hypothetical protein
MTTTAPPADVPIHTVRTPPIDNESRSMPVPGTAGRTGALRLRLRAPSPSRDPRDLVDGAWWPHTDDLAAELAPLLAETAARGYLVHRVDYSLGAWQDTPRRLHLSGALVRLSGYRTQPAAVIHLVDSSGRPPLVLAVVPAQTAADAAEAALRLAATGRDLDATHVLDATTA